MTYDVRCNCCGKEYTYKAPITHTKEDIPPCPKCGAQGDVTRLINQEKSSGFVLRGKGWFKDGYGK